MEVIGIVVLYIVFTICVGILAEKRRRSVVMWLLVSLIFSPLVAGIILLCLGEAPPKISAAQPSRRMPIRPNPKAYGPIPGQVSNREEPAKPDPDRYAQPRYVAKVV